MDPATMQAAQPYLAPLLQLGVAGVFILVLLAVTVFLGRNLLACLNSHVERVGAVATVIANDTAAKQQVAKSMEDMADRLERIERRLDTK